MSLPEISKYYFSATEFERMGEAGVFTKDARLELIEGWRAARITRSAVSCAARKRAPTPSSI